jgi:ubiquinone biosynthesis protein UbiJ
VADIDHVYSRIEELAAEVDHLSERLSSVETNLSQALGPFAGLELTSLPDQIRDLEEKLDQLGQRLGRLERGY